MIKLENVSRAYRMGETELYALNQVSLQVGQGEFVAVTGPSGSGKSTLLHLIGGLDRPSSGTLLVDGQDLSRASDAELAHYRNQKVGFVFQSFNLEPTLDALNNVQLPLVFAGISRRERLERAEAALEKVGMAHRSRHYPGQLSGGERQRVGIARALVNRPSLVLADEPTGNLDSKTGTQILDLLLELNQDEGLTVVMVTHNLNHAQRTQRIIVLLDGVIESDTQTASPMPEPLAEQRPGRGSSRRAVG